ncbi:MAG: hypothetical protein ACK4N5_10740, partial [Myxococcales bacterium]
VMLDTVPPGPVQNDARWMQGTLTHPEKSAVVLVTLPEAMPVNETLELHRALRDVVRIPVGAVVLNGAVPAAFSPAERALLRDPPAGTRLAAEAALSRETRAEQTERYGQKLRDELRLPQLELPFLFTHRFGRAEVERMASLLERA